MTLAFPGWVSISKPLRHDASAAAERFFEQHLAGVRARLEVSTKKALERQHLAWRDTLRREALLAGKDFQPWDRSEEPEDETTR